jgi:ribosomal protein S12 methylthiotransferase accessory factor YcaO
MPRSWRTPERFCETVCVNGVRVYAVGLCADNAAGDCVTGSAASLDAPDSARAYFELLERAAIMDAVRRPQGEHPLRDEHGTWRGCISAADLFPQSPEPEAWQYARSNGVALGIDLSDACARATCELIERDRILRSWNGEVRPLPVEDVASRARLPMELRESYDFQGAAFPACSHEVSSRDVTTAAVFGFPRQPEAPLIFGFAARGTAAEAFMAAGRECTQRLAFLWGEPIPTSDPVFAPTAEFHQEYFLYPGRHAQLRSWLAGDRYAQPRSSSDVPRPARRIRYFADLTPASLRGKVVVVKAVPGAELPLCFGRARAPHGRWPMDFHPIP